MIFTAMEKPSFAPSINASYTFILRQAPIAMKAVIIEKRITLLATVEIVVIVSLSNPEKYQIKPPTAKVPPL